MLEIPVERDLQFEPYFRESVEQFFIELGSEAPNKYFTQQ
jgi:hypothetical protein